MKNLILLFVIFFSSLGIAQVKISGDARVRPRYDINNKVFSGGNKSQDLYYMYRARLKFSADIGEGWQFNTMISHNGIADYSIFNAGDYPDILGANQSTTKPSSNESSRRATLSFMELYFGKEIEDYGFRMGLFPLGSMNNPLYDLHYYPNKMVDIPFLIYNTDGAYGLSGYVKTSFGKFGAKVLVEDAKGKEEENSTGKLLTDFHDQYSFEFSYSNTFAGLTISPMALVSISRKLDSAVTPNTFGINITSPKFANLTIQTTFAYSVQNTQALKTIQEPGYPVSKYNAYLFRVKLSGPIGPGNLLAWIDVGSLKEKVAIENKYDFLFTWISYEIPIFKSDKGSFSITPELRIAEMKKNSNKTAERIKMEMNFDIKF